VQVPDQTLVGRRGSVTVRIPGGLRPGEIRLVVQGIPHHYIAFCPESAELGAHVLVIHNRGSLQVDVEPWPEQGIAGLSHTVG
jgi:hypothetical protein